MLNRLVLFVDTGTTWICWSDRILPTCDDADDGLIVEHHDDQQNRAARLELTLMLKNWSQDPLPKNHSPYLLHPTRVVRKMARMEMELQNLNTHLVQHEGVHEVVKANVCSKVRLWFLLPQPRTYVSYQCHLWMSISAINKFWKHYQVLILHLELILKTKKLVAVWLQVPEMFTALVLGEQSPSPSPLWSSIGQLCISRI